MVTLNFAKELPFKQRGFTITVPMSDVEDYLQTLNALIELVTAADMDSLNRDMLYYVLNLVQSMLPCAEQLKY